MVVHPIIPATQETEGERTKVQGQPWQLRETLCQKKKKLKGLGIHFSDSIPLCSSVLKAN